MWLFFYNKVGEGRGKKEDGRGKEDMSTVLGMVVHK